MRRSPRWAVPLAAAAALGMARRPPERKTMEDPAALADVDVKPSAWSGAQCAVSAPGARVVTDAQGWERLWKDDLGAAAPPVDFSRFAAVAAFAGLRPTGGWSPEFLPAERSGAGFVVPVRLKGPAAGGFVIQAFTQAWAVRLYRRAAAPLTASLRP